MHETEILERIATVSRRILHDLAEPALERGDAMAIRVARAASLVMRLADFLSGIPRSSGDLRILRARASTLLELLGDGDAAAAKLEVLVGKLAEVTTKLAVAAPCDEDLVARALARKMG